jgi:hypothetical protein
MDSSRQRYNIGILFLPVQRRVEKNSIGFLGSIAILLRGVDVRLLGNLLKCLMIESLHCIP